MFCPRCKTNDHGISSKKCPVYAYEDAIQHIRVDNGISYPAAKRIFDAQTGRSTFAAVTTASKDKLIEELSEKVNSLVRNSEEKDKKIAELENTITHNQSTTNVGSEAHEFRKELDELRKELQKKDHQIAQLLDALKKQNSIADQVKQLRKELHQKDERIKMLEKGQPKENRMELTRKYGTIEDLVATVKTLQHSVNTKDKELTSLRKAKSTTTDTTTTLQRNQGQPQSKKPMTQVPYTGTKKKVSQQPSCETDAKRCKEGSPSRISNSDEEMTPAETQLSSKKDLVPTIEENMDTDFLISSGEDEGDFLGFPDPISNV